MKKKIAREILYIVCCAIVVGLFSVCIVSYNKLNTNKLNKTQTELQKNYSFLQEKNIQSVCFNNGKLDYTIPIDILSDFTVDRNDLKLVGKIKNKFDYLEAKRIGKSDNEIELILKEKDINFDLKGAKRAGATDNEIAEFLKIEIKKKETAFVSDEGLILNENDRKKLDVIVSKMLSNNESEDNIKFVVSDFKQKYAVRLDDGFVETPIKNKTNLKPDELKNIVQRMIDAGEPEEKIATFIREYDESEKYAVKAKFIEKLSKEETNKINAYIADTKQFKIISNSILSEEDIYNNIKIVALIFLIALFIIRYLYYTVSWSVKTLKE